jgi:hypothetical protein
MDILIQGLYLSRPLMLLTFHLHRFTIYLLLMKEENLRRKIIICLIFLHIYFPETLISKVTNKYLKEKRMEFLFKITFYLL